MAGAESMTGAIELPGTPLCWRTGEARECDGHDRHCHLCADPQPTALEAVALDPVGAVLRPRKDSERQ